MKEHLESCRQSIIDGDAEKSAELAKLALEKGMDVLEVIENGFVSGIREVGRLWEEGELFLPELVIGADAMKKAMDVLQPSLEGGKGGQKSLGHVVIGTIEGDIHDIGK
ncbi:MAG: B12-binding domain-containing protein, partial [Candidatus Krumholzibacteria bacterium]|nr:B12-binding domain-containing protein [Candidatus Krumholzibacteria bacterium]